MIRRIAWVSILSGLCLQVVNAGIQKPGPPALRPAEQDQEKKDPFRLFHWLTDSSDTHGLVIESRTLASLSTFNLDQPPSEIETEVTRPDANSMRVTSRVYGRGPNGDRTLNQLVIEDLRATPGRGISATRTISQNDINGRQRIIRKETQETVPAGPDTFRTHVTVTSSRGNSTLARSEEVLQVEKKKGSGMVEIERSRLLSDVNGNWATADKRVSSTRETNGQVLSQEDIYKPDVNGKLALVQQNSGREWKDPQSREHQDTDTYVADPAGRLQLNARSNITRTAHPDGSKQTTQTLLRISPVSPADGFKIVQKIVETSRPAGSKMTEKEIEVLVPDANGKLQTTFSRKIEEKE